MGSKRNVDMSSTATEVKIVEDTAQTQADAPAKAAAPKQARARSKKYTTARSFVDKTKLYTIAEAIELLKKTSYSSFAGTISAHGSVKETGTIGDLSFPHSTGTSVTVVIVDDAVIEQIEAGKLDFDVLVTTPRFMPKLAKHARVLGPKGLMPNPKNGTVTENPELKKSELEAGKITLKTEKKAPLFHVTVGKTDMDAAHLVENIEYLINQVGGTRLKKLSISATMSPGLKIKL